MKSLIVVLAAVLVFGSAARSQAGNRPALTYAEGNLVSSNSPVQMDETTPWHKGALHYSTGGMVVAGANYRNCPVMKNVILSPKHESEVTLSNGKRIMLCWAGLKNVVESDLKKYETYMY